MRDPALAWFWGLGSRVLAFPIQKELKMLPGGGLRCLVPSMGLRLRPAAALPAGEALKSLCSEKKGSRRVRGKAPGFN